MTKSIALRVLCAALFILLIGWAPQPALASGAHGGGGGGGFHGGGGGFHGGGGGFHSGGYYGGGGAHYASANRGGAYYGGYHGGGYYPGHGGYYGHGGYWGYPRYGYGYGYGWGFGIGFGIGFGWGSYWSGYPYYGYYTPPYYPYYYPYAYPYPYPYTNYSAPAGDPPSNQAPPSQGSGYAPGPPPAQQYSAPAQQYGAPAQQSNVPLPPDSARVNAVTIRNASYSPSAANYRAHPVEAASGNYRTASSTTTQLPHLRPEVQNVIRALRAMPPGARESQLGRYGNLTPNEVQIVRYAAGLPSAAETY